MIENCFIETSCLKAERHFFRQSRARSVFALLRYGNQPADLHHQNRGQVVQIAMIGTRAASACFAVKQKRFARGSDKTPARGSERLEPGATGVQRRHRFVPALRPGDGPADQR